MWQNFVGMLFAAYLFCRVGQIFRASGAAQQKTKSVYLGATLLYFMIFFSLRSIFHIYSIPTSYFLFVLKEHLDCQGAPTLRKRYDYKHIRCGTFFETTTNHQNIKECKK
ncbi:MAG: hypothetical protein ACI8RD_013333 [Bacillariaceae sp.]|jgi:hypothetical protein